MSFSGGILLGSRAWPMRGIRVLRDDYNAADARLADPSEHFSAESAMHILMLAHCMHLLIGCWRCNGANRCE